MVSTMDHGIGEFARLTGLTVKALRHYDTEGILVPGHVDPATRHRSYDGDQVADGRLVRSLRDVDLPLALVRLVLEDPARLPSVLEAHRRDLEARIVHDQHVLHRLVHLQTGEAMSSTTATTDDLTSQARAWFNGTWTLMEQEGRTAEDDDRMLHMAHASRFAWGEVGGPEQRARGEWQCSRVYTVLGRAEPALHHARRVLAICQEHGIGDWDLGFAWEAIARAASVAGDRELTLSALASADAQLAEVKDAEDANLLHSDLAGIVVPD